MSLPHRYVFVGGLHRSGTSLVARLLQEHPDISGIENAPAPENEGAYLQGAIPHTARHGVPVHFATDPAQHFVEGSPFDTLATRERLEADWSHWFDSSKPWRVEKSPVNLTRMRLYQSLFPLSQFIVVLRRPEFVAAAMRKWNDVGDSAIIAHWNEAHRQVEEDLANIHCWLIVRYEDLVANPLEQRRRIFAFLDLPMCESQVAIRNGNKAYESAVVNAGHQKCFGYEADTKNASDPPLGRHMLRRISESIA